MSKIMGQHFICIVENGKLVSTEKLKPHRMFELMKYLVYNHAETYEEVIDLFDYFPVDFNLKYSKPVQMLYIDYSEDRKQKLSIGYIVYAYNKTKAELTMYYTLKGKNER